MKCWKYFLCLTWAFSPSSIPIIIRFIHSQYHGFPGCVVSGFFFFLDLTLSLNKVSISFILSLCLKFFVPSLIFCWWGFSLRFLNEFLNFSFPQFGFFLLILFFLPDFELFYPFLSNIICVFVDLFKALIHPFKELYHIHKSYFKVLVVCFRYAAILRTYCALVGTSCPGCNYVFMLASKHLGLGLF